MPDTRSILFLTGATFLAIGAVMGMGAMSNASANVPSPQPSGGCNPGPDCLCNEMNCENTTMTQPVFPPASGDVDTLARTAWGEARGEGYQGMQAVANVVMNRVHAGNFPGGSNVSNVCRAPRQFSCWNPGDPNRAQLLAVTTSNPQFQQAMEIAQQAVAGNLADITSGATMYHEASIPTPHSWGKVTQVADIGNHIFYVKG